jgi:hypothetical protein
MRDLLLFLAGCLVISVITLGILWVLVVLFLGWLSLVTW